LPISFFTYEVRIEQDISVACTRVLLGWVDIADGSIWEIEIKRSQTFIQPRVIVRYRM
jgi:hypothetical protein